MPEFVPGLVLSERYFREIVEPILDDAFPGQPLAAALIGPGSDVVGFDTERSTDHHWGPRLQLFLREEDLEAYRDPIDRTLRERLPYTFLGYPTNFGPPDSIGVRLLREISSGPVDHMIEITTVRSYLQSYLGLDTEKEITPAQWLTRPEHRLLAVTSGKVFRDDFRELSSARERLAYYPRDVWLYMLASQWAKIGQEDAFMGRCGDVDDELGSRFVAARLAGHIMRLCFLMERHYAAYLKWFGSAFARLQCGPALGPLLDFALAAPGWREREKWLSRAYESAAGMHNALGITPPLDPAVGPYHTRPYMVIHTERFVDVILAAIEDDNLRKLPLVGSANQFVDSTDVLENLSLCERLAVLYG